ncbi:MAG: phosphatase PAP2 family protein [Aeromicrobium sp.]
MSTFTGSQRHPARTANHSPRGPAVRGLAGGIQEIALLATLWIFYSLSRLVAADDLSSARGRAGDLLHLERYVHLDIEAWLNQALAPINGIAVPMSFWYASLHYLVTPAVLAFLYFWHRSDYAPARNAIVIGSAIGLVCYLLVPMAPPRLMPDSGYLDVLAQTSSVGWWGGDASAPAGLGHITNELAAMPSLHVGWTVWVAWAVWPHTGRLGRALACAYVAGTFLVVIATGNHWVLDAVAGAAVIGLGILVADRLARRRARPDPSTP